MRFFNNKLEITFSDANADFCMNLSDRGRDLLVLDKRVCWSRILSENSNKWINCQNELKQHCSKFHVQKKAN